MTYAALLTELFSHFVYLSEVWRAECEKGECDGVLAFMPEAYSSAAQLEEVQFTFWPRERVSQYLQENNQPIDGFLELLESLDEEGEFLAMIVEDDESGRPRAFHLNRILRVEKN